MTLCDRLHDKMYSTIYGSICFRRLNATHSTGCGSSLGGSVGVLHLIQSSAEFEFLYHKPPAPPYTLLMAPWLFNRQNILNVTSRAKGNIAGIVLIENGTNLDSFSHELKCPNPNSGIKGQTCDANQAWNPFGTGLLHENFPFPIIYVKDKEYIQNLTDCYYKFNAHDFANQHNRRLCSIQIKSFMAAAVNSKVCRRRTEKANNMNPVNYCDPLHSRNIYSTLFDEPPMLQNLPKPIILVGARMDTTSMFDGIGLGAMDSLVPAVTLISTAHTLSKMIANTNEIASKYNVLFMLFNGEAYDYIGSQRFVYDLQHEALSLASNYSIKLDDIKLFIDIGSLDSQNTTTIYQLSNFPLADRFAELFKAKIIKYNFNFIVNQETTGNLPPTSAQSFLRENNSFPAVILYNNTNRFYHSIYDSEQNIKFVYQNTSRNYTTLIDLNETPAIPPSIQLAIRNISTSLAHSLYELVEGEYKSDFGANPYLIDEMLYCYLISSRCPLFQTVARRPNTTIYQVPPHRYISVAGNIMANETVKWTQRVLGYLTGRHVPVAEVNCTGPSMAWFAGANQTGECLQIKIGSTDAISPAFTISDYDWMSGRYSTWTESTWSEINVRIFLKPAVAQEAFTLAIGFLVLLISFILVYVINSKSDVLFGESTSSINVLTLPAQC